VLRPNAQIADAEGYRNLIIARGAIILRSTSAMSPPVEDSVQDERLSRHFFARGFNPPASTIVMAISRQAGANAVEVATAIRELLPQLRLELPGSINLIPTFDRAKTIERSVHDVQETLIIAFILVIIVIFLFLGRAADTMIPVVALPLSLLITFLAMWALGFSINNLTLMALTLAIGFLVDDAIVFLENVVRRAENGESIMKATLNSAGEISFTILSMTLSLAAVFIPLVFMPGLLGRIFREFAITIIVAIIASGIVSLTLTPLMCARMLKERGPGHPKTWMERLNQKFFDPILSFYSRTLSWFLDHGWLAIPTLVVCAVGLWYFFTALPFTLLPTGDSGTIRGNLLLSEGASPEEQKQIQVKLDPILQANPAGGQILHGGRKRTRRLRGYLQRHLPERRERARPYRAGRDAAAPGTWQDSRRIPDLEPAARPADQHRWRGQFVRPLQLCDQRDQSRRGLRCSRDTG
jgi:HAE1 family hydrophobic/amphiphilic exporter-1